MSAKILSLSLIFLLSAGSAAVVEYAQVKSVKGNNLSTRAKIAIGLGIAAAVIFAIYFYAVVYDD